ncbi:hypothetical protein JAAARDRAFT_31904 [Jaapia argillacea MUCL 33604]|uniref:Uncharacterized protein n=1 Tax=Jaapia argillacea MUCL 33604 TaxID=933084 RepID=A0A067QBL6_9AGAM|nr:hypothetical protein JAAARDRAFT_31904 [Jaapia argillacea MUCL 33604]
MGTLCRQVTSTLGNGFMYSTQDSTEEQGWYFISAILPRSSHERRDPFRSSICKSLQHWPAGVLNPGYDVNSRRQSVVCGVVSELKYMDELPPGKLCSIRRWIIIQDTGSVGWKDPFGNEEGKIKASRHIRKGRRVLKSIRLEGEEGGRSRIATSLIFQAQGEKEGARWFSEAVGLPSAVSLDVVDLCLRTVR